MRAPPLSLDSGFALRAPRNDKLAIPRWPYSLRRGRAVVSFFPRQTRGSGAPGRRRKLPEPRPLDRGAPPLLKEAHALRRSTCGAFRPPSRARRGHLRRRLRAPRARLVVARGRGSAPPERVVTSHARGHRIRSRLSARLRRRPRWIGPSMNIILDAFCQVGEALFTNTLWLYIWKPCKVFRLNTGSHFTSTNSAMSFYSGPAANPPFIPPTVTSITTTQYCVTGPTALMDIGEIVAMILAAAAGGFVGWALSWLTGGVAAWILSAIGTAALSVTPGAEAFAAFLKAIPPPVASLLIGAILGAAAATLFLKACECPSCPPGRKALCFCVTSVGVMVLFILPCTGGCTSVPPGCP